MRNPAERPRDILEAIAAIERRLNGDKTEFGHHQVRDAWFLRHFQIVGEAARAMPVEARTRPDFYEHRSEADVRRTAASS